MTIRPLIAGDRPAVCEMLEACGAFSAEEVTAALDVLDAGLAGEYSLFTAEVDGAVSGYVCVSHTPLTRSTWHLYWICVHPGAQGRGIGRALQQHAEEFVRSQGGERLVLETSSRADYVRARTFYERAGYNAAGRIAGFYRPDDDCIFYCKQLDDPPREPVAIAESPGKGRGIFAGRCLVAGDLIEEAPVVVMPACDIEHLDRTALGDYYFLWGEDESEAALLLGRCSLCNHSYTPNAVFQLMPERRTIRFLALRQIQAGEEITINYNGAPDNRKPVWFPSRD